MPIIRKMAFVRAGIIAAMVAGVVASAADAKPTIMRMGPTKVYLSCKLSPVSENLALMLTITNSTKLTVPNGASVTFTQALGHPEQYHTVIAKSAVAPGGKIVQDVADPNLTNGPCTAWFMSSVQAVGPANSR